MLSEDWVLGRAWPPVAPECLPALAWGLWRIRTPQACLEGSMCEIWGKNLFSASPGPGPGTWVKLLASFTPSALQTEELLLPSLSLFSPLSSGAKNSTCLMVWW